ncbi:MAG: protein translocase subunit SecD [Candidatus Pacebacteria bacterium]|jgi:protein-export membrane protein SecD|nr:protein translocase subunit SecD [Candidatus Paceibacterota bacterium]
MLRTRIYAVFLVLFAIAVGFYVTKGKPFTLGLDLNGGTHLVYKADISKIPSGDINPSMQSLRDVIEKRVNIYGVSEPLVQVEQGGVLGSKEAEHKLVVELPGVTDIDAAVKMIGQIPKLEFRLVKEEKQENASSTFTTEYTGITGAQLKRATLQFDPNTSQPTVGLELSAEGRDIFAKVTKEHTGEVLGIFLDGQVLSLPTIRQEIRDGKAVISGSFDRKEAQALVRDLNYGALPLPIELISTQTIGSSLGQNALQGGVKAGVVAFIIIAIFLVMYYRLPGFVAVLALGMYSVLMLALFKLIPVTLTAAGIAGFILSIGMAVDANILIFERMKEELKRGKNQWDAMHEGFARAWLSIRDSNTSSILTGLILYFFGSSSIITGFALVFIIGVLVSMFSAITASRIFLYSISRSQK